jgi:hypothetical protein
VERGGGLGKGDVPKFRRRKPSMWWSAVEDWAKGMCGGRLGKGDDNGQDAYLIGR